MNAKHLAIAGALTLGLLAPAGAAVAAPTDDRPGGPLGGVLNLFGDHDRKKDKDKRKNDRKDDNRNKKRSYFVYSGTIRSIDTDDRTITVGHGKRGGDTKKIRVDDDANITRDRDDANLRDLRKGDHVRIVGEKKDGRWTATRIRAVS